MAEMPTDVTLGELWRGQQELRHAMEELPSRLARELEAHAAGLRRELDQQVGALLARIEAHEARTARLERIVTWVALGIVGAVGAAVLNLVLIHKP